MVGHDIKVRVFIITLMHIEYQGSCLRYMFGLRPLLQIGQYWLCQSLKRGSNVIIS